MKNLIFLILILITNYALGQNPPEYLSFTFKDETGKTIFPELTVFENVILYDENNDSIYTQSKNMKINFNDELDGRFLKYTDSKNQTVTMISSMNYSHSLGQEIKITAEYENKKMQITFFGQRMQNFDCWKWDSPTITFKEGYFHNYKVRVPDKPSSFRYENFLVDTKIPLDIFDTDHIQQTSSVNKYYALNQEGEIVPFVNLVGSDNNKILGFIFDGNTPIGYGIIEKDRIRYVNINKKAIDSLKKYYRSF